MLTDYQMPGINGGELVSQIRAVRPNMPIVLLSGNCECLRDDSEFAELFSLVLQKPPSLSHLGDALQGILFAEANNA